MKKSISRVLIIVISCLSGEKLGRVWVGRISLAGVQVEHCRQGRAGSTGLAEVILGFLSFWYAGEKWIKGESCWELFFPPLCLTEGRSVLSGETGMETYSTAGKSGRKDLNQLRKVSVVWSAWKSAEEGRVVGQRGQLRTGDVRGSEGSSHSCSRSDVVGMKRAAEGVMLLSGSYREPCGKEWLV